MYSLGAFAGHPSPFVRSIINFTKEYFPESSYQIPIYVITGLVLLSVVLFVLGVAFWVLAGKSSFE